MRGWAEEVAETLTRRKVDVCCVQEVRWRRTSARLTTGKNSEYKMYWVGNNLGLGGVGILINYDKTAYWQTNRRNCINIRTATKVG